MDRSRMFLIGLVILFLGIQLRLVKTYELNEKASDFVQRRLQSPERLAASYDYGYGDDYWLGGTAVPTATFHSVTPPRWIGWSLISVGAVLVLTCPCFRQD